MGRQQCLPHVMNESNGTNYIDLAKRLNQTYYLPSPKEILETQTQLTAL